MIIYLIVIKRIVILLVISIFFLLNSNTVFADEVRPDGVCLQNGGSECCNASTGTCIKDNSFQCLPATDGTKYIDGSVALKCQPSSVGKIFGKVQVPDPLAGLLKTDPTGAGAISGYLSNLIILIYSAAGIVLIFMLIWGAFEWMTSGGDKEAIAKARSRIINALIGILLFAVAFAIIRILGVFTGFTFFKGQSTTSINEPCKPGQPC